VHGSCQTYRKLRNYFGHTGWNSKVTLVMYNLVSVRLVIVLVLLQDRSRVCTKRTIASESVLDGPDGTPR
jgi:hypothetical protein